MESITIGQVGGTLLFIASIIKAYGVIKGKITDKVNQQVNDKLLKYIDPLNESILSLKEEIIELKKSVTEEITNLTLEQCKNYLVRFINDVNNDEPISIAEIQRYYDVRDRYYKKGGNSYIHSDCEEIEPIIKEIKKKLERGNKNVK